MPVYELQPQKNIGDVLGGSIGGFLANYIATKRAREEDERKKRQLSLEEQLAGAQREYYGARAQAALTPKEPTGTDLLNRKRLDILGAFTPEEQKQYLLKPSTTVTTNVNTGTSPIEKSTKGALEKEIVDIDNILGLVDEVGKLTEDDFLTYGGKAVKGVTRADEMLGSAIKLPGADTEFLSRYSQWKVPAQEIYLKKRHEITGVAANPAEKSEIAEAIPDPNKNTPTEYRSKLAQLKRLLMQAKNRKMMFRSMGIENPTPEQLGTIPLTQVPLDAEMAVKQASVIQPKNMSDLSALGGVEAKEKLMKIREGLPVGKRAAFDNFYNMAKSQNVTDEEILAEYMKGRQ